MKREINCINCRAIIEYVRTHNGGDCSLLVKDLHPEIDSLDDPISFLTDTRNWVSTPVIMELFRRVRSIFGDDRVIYEIAKYIILNPALGRTHIQFVKSFWSFKKVLLNIQKINDQWNRTKKIEILKVKRDHAVVQLHWHPESEISKDLCIYNQGLYIFMPMIWGGRPLVLKEECCLFEGAPYCEYQLKYPFMNRFHEMVSRVFTPRSVLMETVEQMEADKKIIENQYEEVNRLNVELNTRMKQLLAVQDTAKAILSILNLEQLLHSIMGILSEICSINRAMIMLVNDQDGYLEYLYSKGFSEETPDEIKDYRVDLRRVSNILARVTNTGHSEYIPRVDQSSLRKENVILAHGKPTSVYVVPLITRSKVIGVIATDAVDEKGVPKDTRETIEIFAPQIAIAIENARYYQKLEKQMADLKKSYALLSRAEKFSFLGNLAARLANEIKDPMATIYSYIQMLQDKFDDEEFRDYFYNLALKEIKRVNDLILELLSMVKTSESRFEYGDFHDLIDKTILLVSPQSNAKNIKIARQFDPDISHVWMDMEKMKQVIINILSNAVEFTSENGKIDISTKYRPDRKGGHIQIEIRDNGIGIHEESIDKIFDPYYTTKHENNMNDGTGLGLFIAHQNMEEHQGSIEVRSLVEEGTIFTLDMPLDQRKGTAGTEEVRDP